MMLKPRISFIGQFFILLGLVGAGMVFGGLIGMMLWSKMTGISIIGLDPAALEKTILSPAYRNATIIFQLITTFFMFFVPAQVFAAIVSRKSMVHLGFNSRANIGQVAMVAGIVFAGLFVVAMLGDLTKLIPLPAATEAYYKKLEASYVEQIKAIAVMHNTTDYLVVVGVIALAPAIFEEVLFRGALQQLFVRWFKHAGFAILLTALIFSAVHFSYYGFFARFALGIVLGYIFYYSKNIWLSILAHFLNNAAAVTGLYFITRAGKPLTPEAMEESYPYWVGILATAALIAGIIIFKKLSAKPAAYNQSDAVLLSDNYSNPFNNNSPEGHNNDITKL